MPTLELPFEFNERWRDLRKNPALKMSNEAALMLEQRDRDLEDYLAGLPGPGGLNGVALFGGYTDLSFSEGANIDATWQERLDFGAGASWPLYGPGNKYLTVPAGTYQITGNAEFSVSPGTTEVTIGLRVFSQSWSAPVSSQTIVAAEDDPALYMSVAGGVYNNANGNDIYMNAYVFTGGDVSIPTQSLRDRSLVVIQLSESKPTVL